MSLLHPDLNDTKYFLSSPVSGIANTAISFSGDDVILNNNQPNNIYFSAKGFYLSYS